MADALHSAALLARLAAFRALRASPSSSCSCGKNGGGGGRVSFQLGTGITGNGSFVRVLSAERLIIAAHLATLLVKLKSVASGIKTLDLLLKAVKAAQGVMLLLLHAQGGGGSMALVLSPDGIVVGIRAAKVVIKGLKMSHKALKARGLTNNPMGRFGGRFQKLGSGIKASWGALDLVRGSQGVLKEVLLAQDRVAVANWNLVLRCYEASKGALSTVEALGFVSAFGKGLVGLKAALGGIGVMIKACVVSKELYVLLIKALGLSHGAREVFNIIAEGRRSAPSKVVAESVRFRRNAFPWTPPTFGCKLTTYKAAAAAAAATTTTWTTTATTVTLLMAFLVRYTSKTKWPQQGQTSRPALCLLFSVQGLGAAVIS